MFIDGELMHTYVCFHMGICSCGLSWANCTCVCAQSGDTKSYLVPVHFHPRWYWLLPCCLPRAEGGQRRGWTYLFEWTCSGFFNTVKRKYQSSSSLNFWGVLRFSLCCLKTWQQLFIFRVRLSFSEFFKHCCATDESADGGWFMKLGC